MNDLLNDFKKIAYSRAVNFRDKYELGNYCGKQIIDILSLIERMENIKIKLIRTPLNDMNISGFIGYKHGIFIVVSNTNQTLGSERFTIVHEIYHILEDRVYIKEGSVIEGSAIEESYNDSEKSYRDIMANAFAAEFLMPKKSLEKYTEGKEIDTAIVVELQHKYGVDYEAICKRLREINIISVKEEEELEKILVQDGKLELITKQLGYSNDLNTPSKDTYLLQKDLRILKDNYDNGATSYDDLYRIFSYLGCRPEKFGYEEDLSISDEAVDFMNSLM
ncbi:MAG: ImmA/IrrE family metallo-endopeptidase [Clostridium paraputrificum]